MKIEIDAPLLAKKPRCEWSQSIQSKDQNLAQSLKECRGDLLEPMSQYRTDIDFQSFPLS